ncbi:MAG TPA: patatin-like phospholipase family protein [Thermoanaerobaculia bacterium]
MNGRRSAGVFVIAVFLAAGALHADAPRPKIGLALGGGGARGCAHVGVLRVLERLHVPIDYVAGTSMGAVVGGLYASGMSPDEIEKALTTVDWHDAMRDRTQYKDLSFRRKADENRYLTAFEAGLRGAHVMLPRGLRSAQKFRFLLQSFLIPVAAVRDFSKLPVPFKAVAADIETGEAVVLDHGVLAEAIRASMSLPGVFTPVEYDGKLLVDGGIADNVPVDVVRAMGADIVIAVDVGSPLMKRDQIGSLFSVTSQVLTILTRQNSRVQLAAADVVIAPPVAAFGTMQFEDARKIIAAGEQGAEQQRGKLGPLAIPEVRYAGKSSPDRTSEGRPLDFIEVAGSRRVDRRIIRAHMLTEPAQPLDAARLRHDVTRLYGLDDFEQVTFSIRENDGLRGLVLTLKDKPWGPTYLRFNLHVEDDLQGDSSYTVAFNATKTRINSLGAEWRSDILFGAEHGFITEYYQPLNFAGRYFIAPGAQLLRRRSPVWESGRRIAQYGVRLDTAWLDAGVAFGEWGELRTGVTRTRAYTTLDTGTANLPTGNINQAALHATLTIIRTDSPTIPHDGGNLFAQYVRARHSLGSDAEYSKLQAEGAVFTTIRSRQTFFVGLGFGTNVQTTLPGYDEFALGGLLSLGGFAAGELHGDRYAILRSGTYYRVYDLSANFGEGVYVGALFEAGNAWLAGAPARLSDIHRSVTAVAGAETIAGPIIVGYGRAETGHGRVYVTIGKTF